MVEDFKKHQAICDLLDIDLTCPHCEEVLIKANERKEERKENREVPRQVIGTAVKEAQKEKVLTKQHMTKVGRGFWQNKTERLE